MKSYRLKAKAKLKAKVNVARMMQPLDPSLLPSLDIKPMAIVPQDLSEDLPQKIEAKVNSRKRLHEQPLIPDYEMKGQLKTAKYTKDYTWRGRSEDSSHFAVAYVEGNEVKMSLVDHWFKFSRVIDKVVERESDEKKIRTLLTQEQIDDALGKKQGPAKKLQKPKKEQSEGEEEGNADEEADFTEKFEDDEEVGEEEDNEEPSAQTTLINIKLSKSGKMLEKALQPQDDAESSLSSMSSSGLSDSSDENTQQAKSTLTREAFVNEMIRLGKVSKRQLEESLVQKFNFKENRTKESLASFLKLVDELKEGQEVFYVLKEEYKRQMPSHASRVQFQTGKK